MAKAAKAATKAAVKSTSKKVAEPALPKKISAVHVGNNVIVKGLDKQITGKMSKADFNSKVKPKVELYNKQNKKATLDAIIKLVSPEKVKAEVKKANTKAAVKGIKQQLKKEAKTSKEPAVQKDFLTALDEFLASDETAIDKLQAVLDKHKKVKEVVPEVKARISGTPQSGEKYRNGSRVSAYYGYKDGKKMEVDRDGYIIGEW